MNGFDLEIESGEILMDGFYRSEVQGHIRYEEGRRTEEEFYLYYKFLPEGIWICRTTASPELAYNQYLRSLDMDQILIDPDHDEPMTENRELIYQCGRYEVGEGWVRLIWKNSLLEDGERRWKFYLMGPYRLETEFATFGLDYRAE